MYNKFKDRFIELGMGMFKCLNIYLKYRLKGSKPASLQTVANRTRPCTAPLHSRDLRRDVTAHSPSYISATCAYFVLVHLNRTKFYKKIYSSVYIITALCILFINVSQIEKNKRVKQPECTYLISDIRCGLWSVYDDVTAVDDRGDYSI